MLDDELEELSSIQKDLRSLQYIAQMTMVYPAWGGDSDTLRVISRTNRRKTHNVSEEIRSEFERAIGT